MPFSDTSSPATRNALGLAALCTTMGILHFAKPEPFDALIPEQLPGTARGWTLGSGVAELAVAALLVAPPTRRLGGRAAQALFIGVFPGNIKMALDWRNRPAWQQAIAVGRLPLQADLVRRAQIVTTGQPTHRQPVSDPGPRPPRQWSCRHRDRCGRPSRRAA